MFSCCHCLKTRKEKPFGRLHVLSLLVTLNLHTIIVKEQITPGMILAATAGLKAALDRTQRAKVVPVTARPTSPPRVHLRRWEGGRGTFPGPSYGPWWWPGETWFKYKRWRKEGCIFWQNENLNYISWRAPRYFGFLVIWTQSILGNTWGHISGHKNTGFFFVWALFYILMWSFTLCSYCG